MAMSAAARDEVRVMIESATSEMTTRINTIISADGTKLVEEITAQRAEIATHRATHIDTEARISNNIVEQNAKNDAIIAEIQSQQQSLRDEIARGQQVLQSCANLDARLAVLFETHCCESKACCPRVSAAVPAPSSHNIVKQ